MEPKDILAERQGRKQAEATRLPPVGFWSYARQDDQLSSGRLTALRSLLIQELQQQYGREPVRLFQDHDTITHGSDWEDEIKKAIDASTFFIPIITPNFVQSEWCCREVELFIEREKALRAQHPELAGSSRMFPVLFIGIDDADPENPAILAALQKLQWFDFRRFRHRSFDESEIREALSDFAGTMRSLLKARLGPTASSSKRASEPIAEGPPAAASGAAEPAEPSKRIARSTSKTRVRDAASRRMPGDGPTRPIEVGDVLNHMFEVKRFIKEGGMGQVFEGANLVTGERVAIKALLPALTANPKVTQLFQREAMTLTRLSHEALVQYRAMAKEPELGVLYIVTEYVDGVDLGEVLDQVRCDTAELERLLARLASGLAAAHRLGAIHRDISPDNIMLPGGDLRQARIIDFGIAKDIRADRTTLIGDGFAGKLSFVAPEQLGDHGGKVGSWTDVYSLALVILAVAKGEKVDMAGSFADAIRKRRGVPDLSAAPASLRPLLADMLRPDPAERVQTMDEVLARLAGARGGARREGTGADATIVQPPVAAPGGQLPDPPTSPSPRKSASPEGTRRIRLGAVLAAIGMMAFSGILLQMKGQVPATLPNPQLGMAVNAVIFLSGIGFIWSGFRARAARQLASRPTDLPWLWLGLGVVALLSLAVVISSLWRGGSSAPPPATTGNMAEAINGAAPASTSGQQVITTASGLRYQVIAEGEGPNITSADLVALDYTGRVNGHEFDSTAAHGQPLVTGTSGVIPGFGEALQLMKKGGRYRVWIPPQLGYGSQVPSGAPFGPNDTLEFDITIRDVSPGMAAEFQRQQQQQQLQLQQQLQQQQQQQQQQQRRQRQQQQQQQQQQQDQDQDQDNTEWYAPPQ